MFTSESDAYFDSPIEPATRPLSGPCNFLESIFQDPCPTLNGTRRVTMPQVLTRRSEPIHPSSQARSPAPTNPKTGSGSDHPGGRSPQSLLNLTLTLSGYCCTLSNCTHRLVSHLTLTGYSCMLNNRTHRLVSRLTLTGYSCMLNNRTHRLSVSL